VAHQPDSRGRSEGEGAALSAATDTIAAIATAPGRGGIGVVRISGPRVREIAKAVLGRVPTPRSATFSPFASSSGEPIDEGVAILFAAPHSYTGEDVLELQGHGGPIVMRELLRRCLELGARIAEPGEFTRRAFLNDRMDLAQAESVADLIDASSVEAARGAARSLAGEFSRRVGALVKALVDLRMHVEACIDFPEEEIDPADRTAQRAKLDSIRRDLATLLDDARQGEILRDGLTVVLIGPPNVGKSSLLNRLAGDDLAIVSDVPGTTRDYVRATISLEGIPIHLIDTAGLRESEDPVERIGIERTWQAVASAGAALFISEPGAKPGLREQDHRARLPAAMPVAYVMNKIDLLSADDAAATGERGLAVSARTGAGMDDLRAWLLQVAGWRPHAEGVFIARERHIRALTEAAARTAAASDVQAIEFMAEELRLAQHSVGSITGHFSADDLLGEIFSRFCLGK
jgi:tRNA modification GTPase